MAISSKCIDKVWAKTSTLAEYEKKNTSRRCIYADSATWLLLSKSLTDTPCTNTRWLWETWLMRLAVSKNAWMKFGTETWHNESWLFSFAFGYHAKIATHTSAMSLCFWSRIFKTTGIPLQLEGLLLHSSSSSLSPSPRTSSWAEKMFVRVPRPKCCPWLYIEKKKNSDIAEHKPAWKRTKRFSHLNNLPFLDWMESQLGWSLTMSRKFGTLPHHHKVGQFCIKNEQ